MRPRILLAAVALITVSEASAQSATSASWPVGSRVRVWTAANRNIVGQLIDVRADTLIIEMTGILTHRAKIAAHSAMRLEVSEGQQLSPASIARGALGGAALGVLTTLVVDQALADMCQRVGCEASRVDYGRGALIGAALGAVAGATKLADRWRTVPVPARITIAPSARRTGIGLSIAFR